MAGIDLGSKSEHESTISMKSPSPAVHSAWKAFIRFCKDLRHGEIEQLKIQGGLPVLAEVTRKKVKFT